MTVGCIGYDCHSGLAHLMRDFYRNRLVQRVLITPHPHYPKAVEEYPYPVGDVYTSRPVPRPPVGTVEEFLAGLSTLLLFETATGNTWDVVERAKKQGTKIVLMPNYEYTPFPVPVRPDLVVCASDLDLDYYRKDYDCLRLNVPVKQLWRQRTEALKFVHHAGHGQYQYAKGTPQIIEAMKHVKSPITMRITGQPSDGKIARLFRQNRSNPRIRFEPGDLNENQLWHQDDVFVNAEQYNGISLMLQEARASGLLVISTDRYPMNTWLPKEPLIPVERYEKHRICVEFDRAVVNPIQIAERIDEWYGRDIRGYSQQGREWAEQNSWDILGPRWKEAMK